MHSRNATSIIHAAITDFCIYIHTPQTYVHSCNVIQTYCTFNSALHILFWPARPLIHFIRFFPIMLAILLQKYIPTFEYEIRLYYFECVYKFVCFPGIVTSAENARLSDEKATATLQS